jgi:hypothetical protein
MTDDALTLITALAGVFAMAAAMYAARLPPLTPRSSASVISRLLCSRLLEPCDDARYDAV